MLGKWSVVVLDPDTVKIILTDLSSWRDPVRFPKNYAILREIIGYGLVTLEGSAWGRHRRIIQPSFQTNFLKEALNRSVPKCSAALVDAWSKAEGCSIDALAHLSCVTLDVIGEVAFSHDFCACHTLHDWAAKASENCSKEQELQATSDPLIQALNDSLKMTGLSAVLRLLNLLWLDKYLNSKAAWTEAVLNQSVDDIIREARAKLVDGGLKQKSLLHLLFEAKDADSSSGRNTLSDNELRDEMKTFILAGHETTSTWCYWALFALAKSSEVQQKLYKDIFEHTYSDSPITLEQIDNMPYLAAFMSEVLRLYSPVGMIVRFTIQEENFKGYIIPANTRLLIPVHLLHRHPEYWSEPEDFVPERWLNPDQVVPRHKFCFLPFSGGARNCIGQRFAEIEAKLILAHIVQAFTIGFAPGYQEHEMTFTNFITMKSKPPLRIRVARR